MNFKYLKYLLITTFLFLFSIFFYLNSTEAEIVVFKRSGRCYDVTLNENYLKITSNGTFGAACDSTIEIVGNGDWQFPDGTYDTPPYSWGQDIYYQYHKGRDDWNRDMWVDTSINCNQPTYAITSDLPSYISLIKQETIDSTATQYNTPPIVPIAGYAYNIWDAKLLPNGNKYYFTSADNAPKGEKIVINFEMQTNCSPKAKICSLTKKTEGYEGGEKEPNCFESPRPVDVYKPVKKQDSDSLENCKYYTNHETPININPRKSAGSIELTIGEPCVTPTPVWQAEEGIPTAAPQPGSSTTVGTSNYTWMCLHAEKTENTGVDNREVALSGARFPIDKEIYIVGCIEVDGEFKCTTGNENASKLGLSESITEYDFNVITNSGVNPITITDGSTLLSSESPIIATSKTNDTINHVFYAVYKKESEHETGESSTLHYDQLDFGTAEVKCITVRWDPYGRVFDSKSLEPMSGVTITLLDKNKDKVSIPGLTNPLKTNKAGFFSFYVPDGDYVLKPIPPLTYSFSSSPQLNLNYMRAYSNLYAPDNVIRQRGAPVHIDIPFDPGKNTPTTSTPVSISFNALPDNNENTTKVVGQVSHPLTLVSIKQKGEEIINVQADEFGYYEVEINNKDIDVNEPLTPVFTKVDLTQQEEGQTTKALASNNILGISTENTLIAKVFNFISLVFNNNKNKEDSSSSSSVAGESIYIPPSSLKGYVYDKQGNVVKNAKIDIILSMSDKVYNSITSSDNGYILVSDGYLPVFDYYLLVYPKGQSAFKIGMGEFLSENK